MKLLAFAEKYVVRNGGSEGYLRNVRSICRRLDWDVRDLTTDRIDAYLSGALKTLQPTTVSFHRCVLRSLQLAAYNDGLLNGSTVPKLLRRVKCPDPNPRAWTHDEISRLLAVAAEMPGNSGGVPVKQILPAWIKVAYSSGLRLGDLIEARHESIRGSRLSLVMRKTRRQHVVVLDDQALSAIQSLPVKGPKIFGNLLTRRMVLRRMSECVKRAGLCGSGKYLRRASATYAEIAGMDATRQLGHKCGHMKRFYLDAALLAEHQRPIPSLPALQAECG